MPSGSAEKVRDLACAAPTTLLPNRSEATQVIFHGLGFVFAGVVDPDLRIFGGPGSHLEHMQASIARSTIPECTPQIDSCVTHGCSPETVDAKLERDCLITFSLSI